MLNWLESLQVLILFWCLCWGHIDYSWVNPNQARFWSIRKITKQTGMCRLSPFQALSCRQPFRTLPPPYLKSFSSCSKSKTQEPDPVSNSEEFHNVFLVQILVWYFKTEISDSAPLSWCLRQLFYVALCALIKFLTMANPRPEPSLLDWLTSPQKCQCKARVPGSFLSMLGII